jgi:hypothetical protein
MDLARVALAVQDGFTVVCATCEWLHRARDSGQQCCGKSQCAGPLAGKQYKDYKGPITEFANMCFVCGSKSTHAIRHNGGGRVFGLCREHLRLVNNVAPAGAVPTRITHVVADNRVIPAENLLAPKKKSLIEEIMKVESHFASKADVSDED